MQNRFMKDTRQNGVAEWVEFVADEAGQTCQFFDTELQFQRATVLHAQMEGDARSHAVGQRATKASAKC